MILCRAKDPLSAGRDLLSAGPVIANMMRDAQKEQAEENADDKPEWVVTYRGESYLKPGRQWTVYPDMALRLSQNLARLAAAQWSDETPEGGIYAYHIGPKEQPHD